MKSSFSNAVILLLASNLVLPAHIFGQTLPLSSRDQNSVYNIQSELGKQMTKINELDQSGWKGKAIFSLSPVLKNSITSSQLSAGIQNGSIKSFYSFSPADPLKLGMKMDILATSSAGVKMNFEVLKSDATDAKGRGQAHFLKSFPEPVRKSITATFANTDAVHIKLQIDQAARSAYSQAVQQLNPSEFGSHKFRIGVSALIAAVFMPDAVAETFLHSGEQLICIVALGVFLFSITKACNMVWSWKMKSEGVPPTSKEIWVAVGLMGLSWAIYHSLAQVLSDPDYSNDGM